MIDKPPPLDRDYKRDPNVKALKKGGGLLFTGLDYHNQEQAMKESVH